METPELVLFDLDGTLVDSAPDLAYSIDCAMEELGLPKPGEDRVRGWIGRGAEILIRDTLDFAGVDKDDSDMFSKTFDLFSEIYIKNTSAHSRLYPGARETLDHLKELGCKLGCVTNKRGRFTEPVLKSLNIFDDFQVVVSGDTLEKKKPQPDPLFYAVENTGTTTERSLMVGDSVNDVQAARAANMPIFCVSYGYNHGQDIADSNPDRVMDSLSEMIPLFS